MKRNFKKAKRALAKAGTMFALTCFSCYAWAQSTNAASAVTTATNEVKKIFSAASTLCLAIGGIIGLVGGVIVFQKWQQGDPQSTKFIAGWIGSTVFLVLTGTILKTMFGL